MKHFLLALLLTTGILTAASAQQSVFTPATMGTTPIAATTTTALRIINGIAGKSIYVTALNMIPVATSVVTFSAGTGTNCATGTTNLTGAMTFAAGQTLSLGNGYGAVLVVPQSADLCVTISTANAPGSLGYAIF
jgi:hypothetical protein